MYVDTRNSAILHAKKLLQTLSHVRCGAQLEYNHRPRASNCSQPQKALLPMFTSRR